VTQLLTHLQRLECELATIEAARKRITSQIREAKKTLESSRGATTARSVKKRPE
jgi:chaperonin cofactor prefoldin